MGQTSRSAAGNGITLLAVSGIVNFEAIRRLIEPPAVDGVPMLVVALVGVGVNIAAAWILVRAHRISLDVEGAYQHILTDLYGFIGTVIADVVIVTTGYTRADAIASLVVVALMLKAAYGLLRDSGRILLEAAPDAVDCTTSASTWCASIASWTSFRRAWAAISTSSTRPSSLNPRATRITGIRPIPELPTGIRPTISHERLRGQVAATLGG